MNQTLLKQCAAEFVGTFTLIFVGVGAIANDPGLLGVALAHGLAIAVMVSATGGISGGHLNPAVTLGVLVGGKMDTKKACAYWAAQLAGAAVAAFICVWLLGSAAVVAGTPDIPTNHNVPPDLDSSVGIPAVTFVQAVAIEAILTFFLVFVVYGTAVDDLGEAGPGDQPDVSRPDNRQLHKGRTAPDGQTLIILALLLSKSARTTCRPASHPAWGRSNRRDGCASVRWPGPGQTCAPGSWPRRCPGPRAR